MSSTELYLISKVIHDHDLTVPIRTGLKPDHLAGEWVDVWQWITDYNSKHGSVPTERAFASEYGHLSLYTPHEVAQETYSGLLDEVFHAYRSRVLLDALQPAINQLNADDIDAAFNTLTAGLQKAAVEATRMREVDIIQNWEDRIARYEEMRKTPNALRGIPTGFIGLDRITQGLRPQQFIVLAGEPKMGKSLIALILAINAHYSAKRPLFVSFEMSIQEQEARHDAIRAGIAYDKVLSGNLTTAEMAKLRKVLNNAKNGYPFIISEDASSLTTLSALASKIQEYQPDVVFVDGVYLMDDEEGEPKGSPQALTNITRGLKRLAQRFDIPIVATTQVLSWKLNNKKTRAVTADAIGYTSSFAQDADLMLSVERNPDMQDQSIIRVVIARSSPTGEVHIQWDWSRMGFDEVFLNSSLGDYQP